jgi:hypothetical protein
MNIYANVRSTGKTLMEIEAVPWQNRADSVRQDRWELDRQRQLSSIHQMARRVIPLARQLSPVALRLLLDAFPSARSNFNPLTNQLLAPICQVGNRERLQQEATWFRDRGTYIVVRNTEIAHQAALSEVLAAAASNTTSESAAAAFIGSMVPIVLRVMNAYQLLCPFLPILLRATARLVSFFHRHGRAGRSLLRLLPTIFRRTVASLQAIRRYGCRLTSALIGCVLAVQTSRVLTDPRLVGESIVRNLLIYDSTVAANLPIGF